MICLLYSLLTLITLSIYLKMNVNDRTNNNNNSIIRHCSLCFHTGHNSSNCVNYPIQDLHVNLLNIFNECIRYNITHFGLNNFQEKRNHIIEINNLSLSEIKLLAKNFGLRTKYNRTILTHRVFDIYVGITERELNNDYTFIQEINERNNLLRIQNEDNAFRNNINIALTRLQTNMYSLSGQELRSYVSLIGIYIHFTSNGLSLELPELPSINNVTENRVVESNIIENNNNYGITIINIDENQLSSNSYHCVVCIENITIDKVVFTNCEHSFCCDCIYKYIQTCSQDTPPRCFICRENTTSYKVTSENTMTMLKSILLSF